MKTVFFIVALAMGPVFGWGQVVTGVNLSEKTDFVYIEVLILDIGKVDARKPLDYVPQYTAVVDYGQPEGYRSDRTLKDVSGNALIYNSTMAAINQFYVWGWSLVSNRAASGSGGGIGQCFILERR